MLPMLWVWSDGLVSYSLVIDLRPVHLPVYWRGSLPLRYAGSPPVLHDSGDGDCLLGDRLCDLRPVLADPSPAPVCCRTALYVRG